MCDRCANSVTGTRDGQTVARDGPTGTQDGQAVARDGPTGTRDGQTVANSIIISDSIAYEQYYIDLKK